MPHVAARSSEGRLVHVAVRLRDANPFGPTLAPVCSGSVEPPRPAVICRIIVGGSAVVDEVGVDPRKDGPFWAKYSKDAERLGLSEAYAAYSTRLRIGIDKVWTTPT